MYISLDLEDCLYLVWQMLWYRLQSGRMAGLGGCRHEGGSGDVGLLVRRPRHVGAPRGRRGEPDSAPLQGTGAGMGLCKKRSAEELSKGCASMRDGAAQGMEDDAAWGVGDALGDDL